MKRRNVVLVALAVLMFISASGVMVYFAHRTFTTTGQRAVAMMNTEELAVLGKLSSIRRAMSTDQVYQALGPPSEDLFLLAKWNGFGGSPLSQVRVYFVDKHPIKFRWIKLGFFVYERNL